LEAGDSGIRSLVSVQGSLAMYAIWRYGSDEHKQRWLPAMATGDAIGCFGLTEPDHGSDPGSMSTRARRDGDDWVLSGGKMWITNAPVADVAVVWAGTPEGVRGFVVPTTAPGFTAREISRKLSLRASATGEIVLDDVRLPDRARLPEARGLRAPLSCLTQARYGIVWGALGAARDCLSTALRYATTREQFGRPLAGFQLTQAKLADMATAIDAGALLTYRSAWVRDVKKSRVTREAAMAKMFATEAAQQVIDDAVQICGGLGVMRGHPVEKLYREVRALRIYEGATEVQKLIIAKDLLKS
jgi:glutaryl-CoA dehydrogenase